MNIEQYAVCAPVADEATNTASKCMTEASVYTRVGRSPNNSVIEEPDIVACDHFFQWIKLVNNSTIF